MLAESLSKMFIHSPWYLKIILIIIIAISHLNKDSKWQFFDKICAVIPIPDSNSLYQCPTEKGSVQKFSIWLCFRKLEIFKASWWTEIQKEKEQAPVSKGLSVGYKNSISNRKKIVVLFYSYNCFSYFRHTNVSQNN